MKRRKRKGLRILAILLTVLGILLFAALYRGLIIRRYEVVTGKLKAGQPIRAVLLADLHSYMYKPAQEPIIRRVKDLEPDVIFLSGDMADDRNPFEGLRILLEGIVPLAPCFYVSGSHDYWGGDIDSIKESIGRIGVAVLEGQTEELTVRGQRLLISGIDDPIMAPRRKGEGEDDAYRRSLYDEFGKLDRGRYNILVAHRPDFYQEYNDLGFDLVLSGHTHGGQVRIPILLNGLFAPNQGFFPKYAGGLYDIKGTQLVISRGLSFYPELPRIFNPPEIVLVTIRGTR